MIFTFYSFKGGVGRSMTMAAVAYVFAKRGLKVLTIDCDLEAPGLERYFFESERAAQLRANPGFIDLLLTYKLALTSESEFSQGRFKKWWSFVEEAIPHAQPKGGSVDVMTAGQREPEAKLRDYASAVRSFDWLDFFHNWKGDQFFGWLRRELLGEQQGATRGYDVVLIDSRTGVTEMGGVCTYQLADCAVMLCSANYQSMDGTLAVARDFQSDAVQALRKGRPLELLVLPSRLEENNERREEFLKRFESMFERTQYFPRVLFETGLDYRRLAQTYDPELAVIERLVGEAGSSARTASRRAINNVELLADALTLIASRPGKLREQQQEVRERLGGSAPAENAVEQIADPTLRSSGFDVFLAGGRGNLQTANVLAQRLSDAGLSVYFDNSGLQDNDEWMARSTSALESSEVLVALIGAQMALSFLAYFVGYAERRGRPRILPVLVRGNEADTAEQLQAFKSLRLSSQELLSIDATISDNQLESIIQAIRARPRTEPSKATIATGEQREPYVGARALKEDDAAFFFGRDNDLKELLRIIEDRRIRITLLVGASGVGKTSLLRAGLIPHLRKGSAMPSSVEELVCVDCVSPEAEERLKQIRESQVPPKWLLIDSVDSFPSDGHVSAVRRRIDVIEKTLAAVADGTHAVLVVRDTLPRRRRTAAYSRLCQRFGEQAIGLVQLTPMDQESMHQAIEKPAARLGHTLDPGLTQLLIDNCGSSYSGIAQVARVLPLLWQERRRGWITMRSYDAAGGVRGVFARAVAATYAELPEAQKSAFDELILSMSQFNGALQLISSRNPWDRVATIPRIARADAVSLRDRLADAHLIDVSRNPVPTASVASDGDPLDITVALIHGSPSQYGQRYTTVPDPAFVLWRASFCAFVQKWEDHRRDPGLLLIGPALIEAEDYAGRSHDQLNSRELTFINASAKAEARARRARELARRLQVGTLSTALLFVTAALGWALWQSRQKTAAFNDFQSQFTSILAQLDQSTASAAMSASNLSSINDGLLRALRNDKPDADLKLTLQRASQSIDAQVKDLSQTGSSVASHGSSPDAPASRNVLKPRLYIQIAEAEQRPKAVALQKFLQEGEAQIIVPGVELVRYPTSTSVLRCFRPTECAQEGRQLLSRLNNVLLDPKITLDDQSARYANSTAIRPRHFELWLAGGSIVFASY